MFRTSKRSIVLLAVIMVMVQACSMPGTATPTPSVPLTLYVATTGNDANDCLSEAAACQTLYGAYRRSTPGSTVHIGPGEFSRTSGGALTPRFGLNLIGAGRDRTTLTSPSGDVIQLAYAGRFVIQDLTIAGTDPTTGGGNGIEVREGVTLLLENCRIRAKQWGLRLLTGAAATVRNCSFVGSYYGVSNSGDLTLSDSTFTTNQIGLANYGTAQVEDVVFDNNGVFDATSRAASPTVINSHDGQLTMTGGRIANSHGYAFIVDGGTVTLTRVEVHNNVGMAVWHQQGSLEVESSVIRDNGAYGITVGGRSGVASIGRVNVHETAVVRNGSAGVRINGGMVTLENVTVSGNRATTSGGGGIWMYGGELFLLNTTVAFNTGHGIEAGPAGDIPAAITARRSVVAANSIQQCMLDSRVSTFYGTSPYMCVDTTATALGLSALTAQSGTIFHPLQAGSPLIDAGGPVALCPGRDQRNYARPAGSTCDVGAYELNASPIYVYVPPVVEVPVFAPTATPAPTPIAMALSAPVFTFKQQANCRVGPNTLYDSLSFGQVGEQVPIEGLSDPLGWYYVQLADGVTHCFVAGSTGEASGPLDDLPVIPAPPLATSTPVPPVAPTLNVSNQVCDTTKYVVRLSWKDVDGETGYRVYRDGSLIATLATNVTIYDDTSPDYDPHEYRLEAFNGAGVAGSTNQSSEGCLY